MATTYQPLSVPRDPTGRDALARLSDHSRPLTVSIALHLIAAAEQGRVRNPAVAILVDWAREIAA